MAIIERGSFFSYLKGSIKNIIIRSSGTGTHVYLKPVGKKKFSEAQKQQQITFTKGAAWGNYAKDDQQLKGIYQKKAKGNRSVYHIALRDKMNPPVIKKINLSRFAENPDQPIVISAWDDFKVVSVTVKVLGAEGKMLEFGQAFAKGAFWYYHPGCKVDEVEKVEVTATDLPGNEGRKSEKMRLLKP